MKEILIATNNYGKVKEIEEILKGYKLFTLKDLGLKIEVKEDGKTFEENSLKKAKEISDKTGMPCIADDSGLCIDELDGFPGVNTARYIGNEETIRQKNLELIEKLKDKENKVARFVCVVTFYYKGKKEVGKGEIIGKIAESPRGENGFGFDEIFELESGKTLAELSLEEKNKISSRKIAIENLKDKLSI